MSKEKKEKIHYWFFTSELGYKLFEEAVKDWIKKEKDAVR